MKKISFKGIALGTLAMLALDIVAGIGMLIAMSASVLHAEMTEQEMIDAIAALALSRAYLIGSMVFGTLATVVGGYVSARIAKQEPYRNAGAVGVVGIVFGLLLAGDYPVWFDVLGYGLVIPAALLGGHLAKPRTSSQRPQETE